MIKKPTSAPDDCQGKFGGRALDRLDRRLKKCFATASQPLLLLEHGSEVIMFDFLFPTHPFGGQTLRLVAQAQQGGGDVFDIARTCARIEPGDKDGWERGGLCGVKAPGF